MPLARTKPATQSPPPRRLINALYLFIPRSTDSMDAVVVTVGQVIGGDNPNVIPEWLHLNGTLRTLDRNVRKKSVEQIRRIAHGIGQTSETNIDVQFCNGCQSVNNDAAIIELFKRARGKRLGPPGDRKNSPPQHGRGGFCRLPGSRSRRYGPHWLR